MPLTDRLRELVEAIKRVKYSVFGYLVLYLGNHYLLDSYGMRPWLALVFITPVILIDFLATHKPEFMALVIANRDMAAFAVLTGCVTMGSLALWYGTAKALPFSYPFLSLIQFSLQGLVVGVVVRMLVLAIFSRLLKGGPVETHRLLLLVALTISLWLFPLNRSHRAYAGFYLYGFGIGFALHYLVRHKEHARAQVARLGRNIIELMGSAQLQPVEVDAIRHYANQEWRALDALLSQNELRPTTVLAIVKACVQQIKGHYDEARTTVEAELQRSGRAVELDTFLHLHKALSLGDLGLKAQMREALDMTQQGSPGCLLTMVTLGLRLAEDVPLDAAAPGSEYGTDALGSKALEHILEALKLNEISRPALIARVMGRAVPLTWTFLLDAYGYVLLKAGYVRFSRATLTECIYEDPYFASPYLHLGEWCIADILKQKKEEGSAGATGGEDVTRRASIERSRRVGRLCLNIALQLEGKRRSLTRRRAKELLDKYSDVLLA